MEKTEYSQLELFSQVNSSAGIRKRPPNPLLSYIAAYEKTILAAIIFLITGALSFCLGVERGKRLLGRTGSANLDLAEKKAVSLSLPKPQRAQKLITPGVIPQQKVQDVYRPREDPEKTSGYTIQVASYKTKVFAQREAEALKSKGLTAVILSKGSYTILCVGNFPNKESAAAVLAELKKQYRDCWIRRL